MKDLSDKELIQLWDMVYNLSVHMLNSYDDAEEATQSIFEKVLEKKASFKKESKLSTWVYSISYNYLIDQIRKIQRPEISFDIFEQDIKNFKPYNNELNLSAIEERIYVEEIKIGCTLAMLQCLDTKNRFIYILGNIINLPQKEAASICGMNYTNYRKQLSRNKHKIKNFMTSNCGLLNKNSKCTCNKRILIAIERGRLNPQRLLYQTHNNKIKDLITEINEIDEASRIYRNNPYFKDAKGISNFIEKYRIFD